MRRSALCLVAIVAVSGCSVGKGQRPIDERPVTFVDATSGRLLERVVLLPRYSETTGVSTGGGHGPGDMNEKRVLASPTAYHSGQLFRLPQPDSRGVLLFPFFFVGRGVSIDGAVVILQGYQAVWFGNLWDRPREFQFRLERLDESATEDSARLPVLLKQSRIRGVELTEAEQRIFNVIPEDEIELHFTDEDRLILAETLTPR
jgi:hypothetical protein